ncbi:hypothetical protein EVAR_10387_1 [Eumeta japonica]|uniref:Uncharacterized protein n=1 Tax=Eumeta variegata TaxID=151549 RepID=A0A4C1UCE5_EUMVA|nr:hypothetical protein EVAR_10387_1 [Eumeta japonica]
MPDIGYECRGLGLPNLGPSRRSRVAYIHRWKPNRGQSVRPLLNGETERRHGSRHYDSIPSARSFTRRWSRCKERYEGGKRECRRARQACRPHQEDGSRLDYDKFLLSYAKKVIRVASLDKWQERYAEGSRVEITKCYFPKWNRRT